MNETLNFCWRIAVKKKRNLQLYFIACIYFRKINVLSTTATEINLMDFYLNSILLNSNKINFIRMSFNRKVCRALFYWSHLPGNDDYWEFLHKIRESNEKFIPSLVNFISKWFFSKKFFLSNFPRKNTLHDGRRYI